MNKLFNKIAALSVGLAMAIGVGVAVGSKSDVRSVKAASTDTGNILMSSSPDVSTTNGTQVGTVRLDTSLSLQLSVNTTGNNGKWYGGGTEWRLYQANNPSMVLSIDSSYYLDAVTFTYSPNNNGVLTYDSVQYTSTTKITLPGSASSATFGVANTGTQTNGQVRITAVEVWYSSSGEPEKEDMVFTDALESPTYGGPYEVLNGEELYLYVVKDNQRTYYLDSGLTFESSDESVFTVDDSVDSYAIITATGVGSATITAKKSGYNDCTATINVTNGELIGIEFDSSSSMTRTSYYTGMAWEPDGLVVNALYESGDEVDVTSDVAFTYSAAYATTSTTLTVTATYEGETATKNVSVTVSDPVKLTVAQAKAAIDAGTGTTGVCVEGYISQLDNYNSTYKNIQYWISDDGTTSNQLEVYRGKGLQKADFSALTDLVLNDKVVVFGDLTKYNTTYEFADGNYLLSLSRKTFDSITISGAMTKTSYETNESWNPAGFTVTANYSDGSHADVTASATWSYSPEAPTSTSTTSVTCTATVIQGGVTKTASSEPQTVTVTAASAQNYGLYELALTEGDYIIYYNGYAMKNTVSSNRLTYELVTPTDDVISTLDTSIVWHIAQSGDYWTIYNAAVNRYAAATSSNNQAQLLEDGTDNRSLWSVTGTETHEFINKARSEVNNKYLRNNTTYGFACYASGTGGALSLYKKNYTPTVKVLDSLSSTGTLTKTSYIEGESFNPDGLTIWANFTDSTTYPAEDVTSSVTWDSLTVGDESVEGSYEFDGVTKTITISGITVTAAPTLTFTKISSVNQLWPGQELLIANDTDETGVSIATNYVSGKNNLSAEDVSQADGVITTNLTNVTFTLGQATYDTNEDGVVDAVAWTLFDGTYYLYDAGTSSNNYLKGKTTLDSSCYWNISLSNGVVTVKSVTNTSKPNMRYNGSNSIFSCYLASAQADITFYVKDTNSDGTSAAKGFADTFMHMDASVEGQCNTYYPDAKAAWTALNADVKAKVISSQASAYARLQAWAAAHGEVINGNLEIVASGRISILANLDITKNNGAALIIVIVSVLSVTAVGGYFLLKKKKTK